MNIIESTLEFVRSVKDSSGNMSIAISNESIIPQTAVVYLEGLHHWAETVEARLIAVQKEWPIDASDRVKYEAEMDELRMELTKALSERDTATTALNKSERVNGAYETELKKAEATLISLQCEYEKLEAECARLNEKEKDEKKKGIVSLNDTIRSLTKENGELKQEVIRLNTALVNYSKDVGMLQKQNVVLRDKVLKLEARADGLGNAEFIASNVARGDFDVEGITSILMQHTTYKSAKFISEETEGAVSKREVIAILRHMQENNMAEFAHAQGWMLTDEYRAKMIAERNGSEE